MLLTYVVLFCKFSTPEAYMFSYAQQNGRNWFAISPILVGNFAQIGL